MTDFLKKERFKGICRSILRMKILAIAIFASLLAIIYWAVIASDRYVSEAHVLIQRTDMASSQAMDFSALLSGGDGVSRSDQMLLRNRLLSLDMLQLLDKELGLREHYSSHDHDILSRMFFHDASLEFFHRHFLSRVSVEYDEYAGVLVIQAQAYDPEMAQKITAALVREGERFMNAMGHQLAAEQVSFLEKQVKQRGEHALDARQRMLAFQNAKGLISPQSAAENLAAVVNKLEAQLTELNARKAALLGYLAPSAPGVVEVDLQIQAVEKQIKSEQTRLTSAKGQSLNKTVEEYQRLEQEALFMQDAYKSALVALEKGRVEATRTLKMVLVLQSPSLPEYPMQPRRLYNIVSFLIGALLLAGLAQILLAIVRDHRDWRCCTNAGRS
ncbi:chain-length determining protein [Comamonas thiooxydans]|uniref:chain-length determining protein n=2 Tax=Comamonas thiooxydans TaxID=363952 RepID=UPI00265FECFA|nr:chain-length determining protein [Comamonas thiooxydans]MDO1476406.1 chain-length determining protein [Comamonas thiooxydans]